ncbi:hypothetical protein D3C73_827680 [compost metagenome]
MISAVIKYLFFIFRPYSHSPGQEEYKVFSLPAGQTIDIDIHYQLNRIISSTILDCQPIHKRIQFYSRILGFNVWREINYIQDSADYETFPGMKPYERRHSKRYIASVLK